MKKTLALGMICCSLLYCGPVADAKKPVKKSKSTTTTTIRRDERGYALVTGHTYRAKMPDGSTYTITFKKDGTLTMTLSFGKRSQSTSGQWELTNEYLGLFDTHSGAPVMSGIVSPDGKTIDGTTIYNEDIHFKLVR